MPLSELPLLAQPGERWLYNAGSLVLGVLAARAANAPFGDMLRERVFAPLGKHDTAFYAADVDRLCTAYQRRDGQFEVGDPPDGQWSRPPAFPDGAAGLVSSVDDVVAFGRMLMRSGGSVLKVATVDEMTRDQLSEIQRSNVWPGFSFLGDRGWGYGLSVHDDGSYGWDGGFGTTSLNIPSQGPDRRGIDATVHRRDWHARCVCRGDRRCSGGRDIAARRVSPPLRSKLDRRACRSSTGRGQCRLTGRNSRVGACHCSFSKCLPPRVVCACRGYWLP